MVTIPLNNMSATALANELERDSERVSSDARLAAGPKVLTKLPEISPEALKLSSKLQATASEDERVILVAGLNANESSSEFAVQLAVGLSEINGQSVLLVDANVRTPSLHKEFGIKAHPGLTNVLDGSSPLDIAARLVKPNLAFLPAGNSNSNSAIFTSAEFSDLFALQLRRQFRFTIVNSAPFTQFVDGNLIAPRADGVVITLTSGRHHRAELLELKNELEALKARIVGVVLCQNK